MKLADLYQALEVSDVLPTKIPTLFCRNVPLEVSDSIRDLYKGFPKIAEDASDDEKLAAAPHLLPLACVVFKHLACDENGKVIPDAQTDAEIGAIATAVASPVIVACMEAIGGKGKTSSRAETTGSP